MRLTLDPAPLTKGALVNEGEGTDFVCHTAFDAEMGATVKLRRYRSLRARVSAVERRKPKAGEKTPMEYRVHGIGGRAKEE